MLKINYPKDIKKVYYKLIANSKAKKFNGLTFEKYYDKQYKAKLGYDLEDILCGDFQKLNEIKNRLGTKYKNDSSIKKLFNYDKKLQVLISKLQPKISKFIETHIEVHTCYFCNIEYINKFENSKRETKNAFTLDHMLDKATYPFLALSLYNLVPSCYTCNSKVKRTNEIKNLSPSDTRFDFEKKVKFKTFMNNQKLQTEKNDDFELLLKEDFSNKFDEYIKILELDNRYKYHKDKVIEMVRKRQDYPDSRIKELSILTQKTEEEVKQDLFGIYLKEDLHKRPLSKLIKDISEELNLI
ncbi:MAG: hypothetical protein Q8N78_04010 [Sulfurimonas sp.]|nr:hypothetical protein [Sulfurimonas sp.]